MAVRPRTAGPHPATDAPDAASRRRLLSYSEQVRLAQQMERGDEAQRQLESAGRLPTSERVRLSTEAELGRRARRALIEAHAPLVLVEARRFAVGDRRTLVDLIHEGNMGLVRAVNEFDWRRGVRLAAFAARWIRLAILAGRPDLAGRLAPAGQTELTQATEPGGTDVAGAHQPSLPFVAADGAEEDPDPAVVISYRRRIAALEASGRPVASIDVQGLPARVGFVG